MTQSYILHLIDQVQGGGSDIWVIDILSDGTLFNLKNIGDVVNTESAEGFLF